MIQLKKADGTEYKTSSRNSAISILSRHVREIGEGDLHKGSSECQGYRDVERAEMKILKSAGKRNRPNPAFPISEAGEQMLYDAGQFGPFNTPSGGT